VDNDLVHDDQEGGSLASRESIRHGDHEESRIKPHSWGEQQLGRWLYGARYFRIDPAGMRSECLQLTEWGRLQTRLNGSGSRLDRPRHKTPCQR
jgi:hypothetical protein